MKLKICHICHGKGCIDETDYFNNIECDICPMCNGSGRIYIKKYVVRLPFTPKLPSEFYSIDEEIHKQINKMNNLKTNE